MGEGVTTFTLHIKFKRNTIIQTNHKNHKTDGFKDLRNKAKTHHSATG